MKKQRDCEITELKNNELQVEIDKLQTEAKKLETVHTQAKTNLICDVRTAKRLQREYLDHSLKKRIQDNIANITGT